MYIIDSHCHLYYEPYISNLKKTIEDCKSKNVKKLLSISVDFETSKKNIEIATKYDEIYCTVGLHPNNIPNSQKDLEKILNLYTPNSKILGIGEAGIDLFKSKDNLLKQIECFELQIQFCIKNDLPLVIHSRNSEKETISVLKKYANKNLNFVLHCFSGTEKFANDCLDLNGYISFGGIITFKNSFNLAEICKKIPINKILVETDSPYLSPHPLRGKVNHPQNTSLVIKKIAEIKQKEVDEISAITTNNFNELFKINCKNY
jgi:TatD DNase family protein